MTILILILIQSKEKKKTNTLDDNKGQEIREMVDSEVVLHFFIQDG